MNKKKLAILLISLLLFSCNTDSSPSQISKETTFTFSFSGDEKCERVLIGDEEALLSESGSVTIEEATGDPLLFLFFKDERVFALLEVSSYTTGSENSYEIDTSQFQMNIIDAYEAGGTVYISWEQDYWIMDQNGNPVKSDKFVYQKVLTIPFSGYADTYTTGGNSEISFSISRLPGAANINLNSGYTGSRNRTDVAQLDLLVNFGTGRVEENRDKVRVFLSSIVDTDRPGEEFRLVHEDANGIATDENSFRYQAIVTSTDGVSQSKAFDGTDYIAADGTIVDTWLNTDCHNENRLLQVDPNYFHFHSFSGIVSIEVSSENDGKTMPAGRYLSRIYVHVVVDE